jgi:hypothetical protein
MHKKTALDFDNGTINIQNENDESLREQSVSKTVEVERESPGTRTRNLLIKRYGKTEL